MTPIQVLKQFWGYDAFRTPQKEIVENVISGNDTLALLPTGGGKSICFQIPGIILGGCTLVISPLIALMKDQVENLQKRKIQATYINSTLSSKEQNFRLEGVKKGFYKFLYISPERLRSEHFIGYLKELNIRLIAIDEAHCISQWGYDFRPEYLKIAEIRRILPKIPMIALTASATLQVQNDIILKLQLQDPIIYRKSFERKNIQYAVLYDENKQQKMLEIFQKIQGTGIVYVRSRKKTVEISDFLLRNGVSSEPYHGGMDTHLRSQIQQRWIDNQTRVIVSTNAFGMGIDKPDVRVVVHWEIPPDLESYYQEAGRAGRDEKNSYAVLFFQKNDILQQYDRFQDEYPAWETFLPLANAIFDDLKVPLYEQLEQKFFLNFIDGLVKRLKIPKTIFMSVLKTLSMSGFIYIENNAETNSWIKFLCNPDEMRSFAEKHESIYPLYEALLREIGGEIFVSSMPFHVKNIAKNYQLDEKEVEDKLMYIKQFGMIQYQPSLREPYLKMLKPRTPFNKENVNWALQEFLRNQALVRLQQISDFAQNTKICRSKMILNYFGEKNLNNCGRCDNCLGRHQNKVSFSLEQEIENEIFTLVEEQEIDYKVIINSVKKSNPQQTKKILRELIDKGKLKMNNFKISKI